MSYGPALSFPSLLKTVMDTHIKKNFEDVPWSAVSFSIPMRCIYQYQNCYRGS
jgi:hypothetical protein